MKNKFYFILFIILNTAYIKAQHIEVGAFGGYTCRDQFRFENGSGRIEGGASFGGFLSAFINENIGLRFQYYHQTTKVNIYNYNSQENGIPLNINYYLLGLNYDFTNHEIFVPYLALSGGVGTFQDKTGYNKSYNNFSAQVEAGLKIKVSRHISFQTQIGLYMPIQFAGMSYSFGTGGSGVGINTYTTLTQFNMGGGLIYSIEKF